MTLKFRFPLLAASALFALTAATSACDAGDTGDAGSPDAGEPEDAGPGPDVDGGPGPEVGGESCAEAAVITPGVISGNTAGASDDHKGPCDTSPDGSAGPDLTYSFTVDERSAVTIQLKGDGAYDPVLFVSASDACDGALFCSDIAGVEESFAGNLDAGTYFIVVDTYIGTVGDAEQTDGAAFTLSLSIEPPQCFDDQFDEPANDLPAGAPTLGGLDVDTLDLDPATPEEDSIDLFLCDAADYFLLPHMGGALDVTVSSRDDGDAPTAALFVADEDAEGVLIEGAATAFADAVRGNYLLKITAGDATPGAEGFNYRIVATHGCTPDESDGILEDDDDSEIQRATTLSQSTVDPLERQMCDDDQDGFVVNSLIAGDVTMTFAGGAGFSSFVYRVLDDDSQTDAVEGTDYTVATAGDDYVVTILLTGKFYVLLNAGTTTGGTKYDLGVAFAAFGNPPTNDTCAANEALVPVDAGTSVNGYTFGATHTLTGPVVPAADGTPVSCNGDGEVPAASETGNANEVFYSFNLATPQNVEINFDGSATGFDGAVYILEFTGATCPADLSTLAPVTVNTRPICETGVEARIRVRDMPAGDYLLVVDGRYRPEADLGFFVIPESTSEGAFKLTATTVPGGFPISAACTAVTTLAEPTAGTPTTLPIDRTGLVGDLKGTCGGDGEEVVFELNPSADVDVVITAGGEGFYDTVLYVLSDECGEFGVEVGCNDDDDNDPAVGNFGSRLDLSLTGGTTYFVVVDSYDPFEEGADVGSSVTISIAE